MTTPTGSFDAVSARTDPSQMREWNTEPDGAVTAHPEVPDVVEEDHYGGTGGINWFAEQCTDYGIGPARFIDKSRPEPVVVQSKAFQSCGER